MLTSERFHDLFLDYLYDLLDEPDAQAVREYVAAHPAAKAELDRAKGLLAGAARVAFPNVSFQPPPADKPLASPRAAAPAPKSMSRVWLRWAVAAALLLAVGGLAGPALHHYGQYSRHRELVAQSQAQKDAADRAVASLAESFRRKYESADKKMADAREALATANVERQKAEQKAQKEAEERKILLVVTGPQAIQPGAPNEFEIVTQNMQRIDISSAITTRVKDKAGKVVFEEKDARSQGRHKVSLPLDLPFRPDDSLSLEVCAVAQSGPQADVKEELSWSAPRYVTHLATDKPMYQPGHTVYFRSLTLNRATLQPPQEDFQVTFSVLNPAGAPIWTSPVGETRLRLPGVGDTAAKAMLGPDQKPIRGIGCGEYRLPEGIEGGEFALTVHEASGRFPDEKRKFMVNKYSQDRLNKVLEFEKKSYGAGDEVVALCTVSLADGGPLVGVLPRASAVVDGQAISAVPMGVTDAAGQVRVKTILPKSIDKGIASLTVEFNDGGNVEAIVRTIPVVTTKLFVEYFPEGGYVVAGVPNRVYYQVKTPHNKPGEWKARVVDSKGQTVATTETLNDPVEPGANQGMGLFTFTPQTGETYNLTVDSPASVDAVGKFPAVQADKVAMSVPTGVTGKGDPIRVELNVMDKARNLLVGAYCRGRLLDDKHVTVEPGKPAVVLLNPADSVGGVVRVTAFEEKANDGPRKQFSPVAERLVYRRGAQKLNITVAPDKSRYAPAEKVSLTVAATDEQGRPARAVLNMSVVNQSIITMADEKTARAMPTHFALVGEVRQPEDLEHADFLFNETNPKAAQALDLLLGVQGWRRFAEQHLHDRQPAHQEAERLLVMEGVAREVRDTQFAKFQEIEAAFTPRFKELEERLMVAADEKVKVDEDVPAYRASLTVAKTHAAEASAAYTDAASAFRPFRETNDAIQAAALPVLAGVALITALVCLVVGLSRGVNRGVAYHVAAAGALAAAAVLVAINVVNRPDGGRPGDAVALGSKPADFIPAATDPDFDNGKPAADGPPGDMGPVPGLGMGGGKGLGRGGPGGGGLGGGGFRGAGGGPMAPGGPGFAPPAPGMMPGPAPKLAEQDKLGFKFAAAKADPKVALDDRAKDQEQLAEKADGDVFKRGDGKAGMDLARRKDDKPLAAARGGKPAAQAAAPGKDLAPQKKFDDRSRKAEQLFKRELMQAEERAKGPVAAGGAMPAPGMAGGPGMGMANGRFGGAGGRGFGGPGGPVAGDMRFRAGGFGAAMQMPLQAEPFVVREFSHSVLPRTEGQARDDFTETVFWSPAVVLNDEGKATVSFQVSDAVTRYRVLAAGHTLDGRLGAAKKEIEARKPFSVETRLPVEMTANDKLDLPVVVINDTEDERAARVGVKATNLEQVGGKSEELLSLKPNQRTRRNFRLQPTVVEGEAVLTVEGKSEPFAPDGKTVRIPIVPEGFPANGAVSDMLEKVAEHKVTIPEGYVPGTLKLKAQIYPSTLAALQKGLEGLLREPSGCFEQTSTTNYPNTLILQYLKESGQNNPETMQRAKEMLGRGYGKLTSFECVKPDGANREGYEWFGGQAPPHEALTAYGLLQFKDMSQVSAVDQEMVARSRKYLLSRMRPDGTFERNSRALDTFGRAPEHITDAYIIWALSETGDEDLNKAIDRLHAMAKDLKDPYFLSLLAQALMNRGRNADAVELLKKVKAKQVEDGGVEGALTSITMSGGRDLKIETTALAILAWFKANQPKEFTDCTEKAVRWIGTQRGGYGGFGSTQSTILALKALIAHTKANKKTPEGGTLTLFVNNQKAGETVFGPGTQDAVTVELKDPEKILKVGDNTLRLELTTQRAYPFTLGWSYQSLAPNSAENCAVKLTTALSKTQAREGETVQLTAVIENRSAEKGQPMTTAIIGLPAGLKIPEDMKQLKELSALKKTGPDGQLTAGDISFFEIRGRELVLYWRDLKPGAKVEITLDLLAAVPGEFRGPASRAYLYYTSDLKQWVKPLTVTIEAQVGE